MKRHDAINHVIKELGLKSVLEIGVQHGNTKNMLKVEKYVGVDPDKSTPATHHMKSDAFFASSKEKFDFIFIDGQHTAEQSLRDFDNALDHLNEGGVIAFHDTLPHNKEYTDIGWCGSVWVTAVRLKQSGFNLITANWDHGVTFVYPSKDSLPFREDVSTDYPGVDKLREILNAVGTLEELLPQSEEGYESMTDEQLRNEYEEKFGKKPGGRTKRETIIKKLQDA